MKIPMSSPDVSAEDVEAVTAALKSGTLSLGVRLREFENHATLKFGVPYAVGVNSGTSGLHLAVIAAGIREGDIGITSPFSFVASANCFLYERAVPVFVDVDPATGNIDPDRVAEMALDISRGPTPERLKALLPVHTFGQPCAMEPILETAKRHGLVVIEDACEAIGAEYKGKLAGTLGDASAIAFYPNKQMTTGEGGMLLTTRSEWNDLFRSLRNQGRDVFDAWLNHSRLGYNYRLDEMSSALGASQLKRLDQLLANRARVAAWYTSRLREIADLVEAPQVVTTTTRMSWFVYVIRVRNGVNRNQVMQRLEDRGIPTRPYFSPIHLQPFYRDLFGFKPGDFPVAEDLGRRSLALPFSGVMNEEQVNYVCTQLTDVVKHSFETVSRPSPC